IGSTETMHNALRWTRGGGVLVQAGNQMAPSSLDPTPVWPQGNAVLGATGHGTENWPVDAPFSTWAGERGTRVSTYALASALMRDQRLTPQRLVTHRFPLREVRQAVEVAKDKQTHRSIKVLLDVRNSRGTTLYAEKLATSSSSAGA